MYKIVYNVTRVCLAKWAFYYQHPEVTSLVVMIKMSVLCKIEILEFMFYLVCQV